MSDTFASTLPAVRAHALDAFMGEAQSWEASREAQRDKSERRAWLVAASACMVAVLAVTAVALMLPLKATVPYLVYVDKTTGNTEVVNALNERIVGYQELNEKHWARHYVIARESYLYTLLQHDYDSVLALSADEVGANYAKLFEGDAAKDKRLGAGTQERINVISVVLPPDQTGKAVVRFEKTVKRVNADQADPPQTFVATMAYEFKPSMRGREKDLIMNPLGFKVTSYRV
jgi:type IV secretion system protein VirB8